MTKLVEQVSDLFVLLREGEDRYNLGQAHFYAIKTDGTYRLVHTDGDVYEGFENLPSIVRLSEDDEAIAVETCGWAAPITDNEDDDTAPSQHPNRRRVRLLSVITRSFDMASALGFADDDDIVTNEGSARGSMANAMVITMRELVQQAK